MENGARKLFKQNLAVDWRTFGLFFVNVFSLLTVLMVIFLYRDVISQGYFEFEFVYIKRILSVAFSFSLSYTIALFVIKIGNFVIPGIYYSIKSFLKNLKESGYTPQTINPLAVESYIALVLVVSFNAVKPIFQSVDENSLHAFQIVFVRFSFTETLVVNGILGLLLLIYILFSSRKDNKKFFLPLIIALSLFSVGFSYANQEDTFDNISYQERAMRILSASSEDGNYYDPSKVAKRFDLAQKSLELAETDEEMAYAHYLLGIGYIDTAVSSAEIREGTEEFDYYIEQALEHLDESIKILPTSWAYSSKAEIHRRGLRKYEEALELTDRCLELAGGYRVFIADCLNIRFSVYERIRELDKYREESEWFLATYPDYAIAQKLYDEYKEIFIPAYYLSPDEYKSRLAYYQANCKELRTQFCDEEITYILWANGKYANAEEWFEYNKTVHPENKELLDRYPEFLKDKERAFERYGTYTIEQW